ncbi:polysaccharide chain length determinant protein, PEP-CTERM locus subfamily [Desulfuromusa kysingii]|uniref:Polysaccharide chain length determinant protein, PEP-CTERM locus subfamily n=1 Tax=Desulfuromusa kysingii TaxID=37625 RepID=A0A1H4B8Y9_9BACT|nr:XrtA system polysaccharide chain length determinant [Desulfuromusa kysingii]SEA44536.1 polysaccharide chain length determinant protein, PEP-CTERM locus subfamily [Desulfuromusa kysingii]
MQNFKELLRYLRALHRHRYLFVFVALMVMTVIGVYSFTLPKKYSADTTVFIERNVIDSLVRGIAVSPDINDRIRVLRYAILSRDLVTKTLEEVGSEIFAKPIAEQQNYISGLIKRINLRIRGQELFTLSLVDKDPSFAQKFVNTLVGTYVEENISAKREETYGANRFLDEQIEIFKAKLEAAEDKIIDFRKKNGIYFSVNEGATLANIRELENQIETIELNQDTLLARKKQIQSQLDSLPETIDMVSESAEGNRLAEMESRLNNLLLKYTDNYPEVIRLKSEIDTLKKRLTEPNNNASKPERTRLTSLNPLHQDLQGRVFELDAELSSLGARKLNLQKTIAKRESELREVPTARKELGILVQERDSIRNVYDELLGRMSQSEVSKQMEIGNKAATFRIVDAAVLPEVPVSPNMMKMFLLAVAGGLGCGVGVIYLLESMDNRIRDVSVFEGLGIDVLAVVPNIVDPAIAKKVWRTDFIVVFTAGVYFLGFAGVFVYEIYLR